MTNRGLTGQLQRQLVVRMLMLQAAVALLLALLCGLWSGLPGGLSALAGGLIYLIPSAYQARRILFGGVAQGARANLAQLYTSEIGKMALTLVLFGGVFLFMRPLEPFPLFATYIGLQLLAALGSVALNYRH